MREENVGGFSATTLEEETIMSRLNIKTIATISLAAIAVAAQSAVFSQSIPLFVDYTGGADQTTVLAKFNPSWGTLTQINIIYATEADATNTVTNIDGVAGTYVDSVHSESYFLVAEDTFTYGFADNNVVDATVAGIPLNAGDSYTLTQTSFYTNTVFTTYAAALSAFSGAGSVIAYQSSFGYAGGSGDHQVSNAGSEFAGSVGYLEYVYKPAVPAPAAAGTMLIGMIGGFIRRRKSA